MIHDAGISILPTVEPFWGDARATCWQPGKKRYLRLERDSWYTNDKKALWSCCTWQTVNVGRKYSRWPENTDKRNEVNSTCPSPLLEGVQRRRGLIPLISNFGARRRWVINNTPRPFYHWERIPIPIKYRLGGPQSLSLRFQKRKVPRPKRDSNSGPSSP
jgi:hypothetical protein